MENPNLDQVERDFCSIRQAYTHAQQEKVTEERDLRPNSQKVSWVWSLSEGLCAALGEERCFYVNHSGVVKESLAKIKKGLSKKKKKVSKLVLILVQLIPLVHNSHILLGGAPDYLVTATHPQAMLTKLTSGLH